jgi:flagellar biosynthesis anti-sigma factor FlgM
MRIDDLNRASVTQNTEQTAQTAQQRPTGKDSADKTGGTGSDHAEVSRFAKSLAASDPARIEQLRLQVESGNYDVSAQSVAKALIEAHLKD